MSSVAREQRHTKGRRCPVCGGADGDRRGEGKRCSGFTSDDGEWVHCSREEHAGSIAPSDAGLFVHRMHGDCNCGTQHGAAAGNGASKIEATYDYRDERGELLFQVVRERGKRFLQRRPDGSGGWIWKLGGARRVLYMLPELVAADPARTVYVAEGEKDVDAVAERGLIATCNPHGAEKWGVTAELARDVLAGRDVVVIADADERGRRHAEQVRVALAPVAKSVKVIELTPHKDAAAFFAAGGTADELEERAALFDATPAPTEPDAPRDYSTPVLEIRRWASEGPLERVPTGIAPLDALCRGGLPVPWRVLLVGAPSAGKTFIATAIADHLARAAHAAGLHVGILAVDEQPDDVTVRLVQMAGFTIAEAEQRDPAVLEAMAKAVEGLRIRFYSREHTIEHAARNVAAWAGSGRGALFVDSVQKVRSQLAAKVETKRAQVDANVEALTRASEDHRLLVVATSEANRRSYGTDDAADNTNDLAAGKETSDLEYFGRTQLMLRTPKGHSDVVRVRVVKNKRATEGAEFHLKLHRERHELAECENPVGDAATDEDKEERKRAKNLRDLDRDAEQVAKVAAKAPGLGERALREAMRNAGCKMSVERFNAAKRVLMDGRAGVRLVNRGDGTKGSWVLEPLPERASE